MTKYTPGPWVWNGKRGSLHQAGTPPYRFGKSVLEPTYEYDCGVGTEVSEVDAALIASAPNLLRALRAAREALNAFYVTEGLTADGRAANLAFIDAAISAAETE